MFTPAPLPPPRHLLLRRAVYELFEWEVEADPARTFDELYRQVRLEAEDGTSLFISWSWGEGMPDYFLAFADSSFFTDTPAAERDVSATPLWKPLIGAAVTVAYRDNSRQVIE